MTNEKKSYQQVFKATSLFGGVQVFTILIKIVRSKFIAILLGPEGMGIAGLLNSTIKLIEGFTSFGLGTSAVKNVAEANATKDATRIGLIIRVVRRLVWLTGTLGALITLIFSSTLSQITFGNKQYSIAFIWLSITLLINQLAEGENVVLRGSRKLKHLAKASLTGSVLGLFFSVPIYYIWGIDGIVPAIIITSIINLLRTWYFSSKVHVEKVQLDYRTTIKEGNEMLLLGIMLSLSGLIKLGASYILRIYISHKGGVEHVGLYSAGFAIVETYVGMIFTAMATDYYPRLSAVNQDIEKVKHAVTQQASIAILLLAPIIVAFIAFIPIIIRILYSTEFIPITSMVNLAILGMFFRAASWAMGFILFAKSDSKLFIRTAIGFNAIFLLNNIGGYLVWGLDGLGLSFLVNYIIHFVSLIFLTRFRYKFNFITGFYRIFIIGLLFCLAGYSTTLIENNIIKYSISLILLIVTSVFSMRELNKRIDLKVMFNKIKNRKSNDK